MRSVEFGWSCFLALVLASSAWVFAEAAPAAPSAAPGQIVLRSTPLGPMTTDINHLSITSDGQHIAVEGNAGSRLKVFIDGNESEAYGSLVQMPSLGKGAAPRLLMISPDQTRYAYVATKGPGETVMVINQKESPIYERIYGAMFSPVGHRLAYIVTKGNRKFVVVDSTVSPSYQQLASGGFSGDGKHFGYVVMSDEKVATWHAVVDGKLGPAYSNVSKLEMGPTGRFAYVANIGSSLTPIQQQQHADDGTFGDHMVVDGKLGPAYAMFQAAVFSADGNHVAYLAESAKRKWVAVIDGKAGPEYDQVSELVFSPDGKHVVYTATNARVGVASGSWAVVDGQKSIDYAGVGSYVYSPDSQHLAYAATSSNHKSIIVLDGKEGDPYDSTILTPTAFSPDSKRFAYIAHIPAGNKMALVLDGKLGPPLPSIDPRSLQFTPDSQHCRFKVGMSADASFFNMDDKSLDSVGPALDLAATADGRHTAIVAAKDVGTGVQTCRVSLDGKPLGETYQGVASLQISADGAHVAYIGFSNGSEKKNAHAVYDGREGPGYFRIDKLLLSPDGQHMAYACTEDGTKHYVVVDSFQGPEYNDVFLGVTGQYEGMQFTKDGSLSFLPVKDGKLSHIIMTPDALAAIPKPTGGAGSGAPATSAPPGYSKVYTFGSIPKDGATPAVLTAAPDGTLYGATSGGGKYQLGVLFKCAADGSGYTILHNWAGTIDGAYPSSIRVGPDGAVYGSLQVQGKSGGGGIYRCSADGSDFKVLRPFKGDDAAPVIMTIDPDGTICGLSGQANAPSHIFRMSPDGSDLKMIFNATLSTGGAKNPIGRFTDGGDGYYYGAAGTTLFKLKKDGTDYSVLRKFDGAPTDAAMADYAPILGSDGKLYGIDNGGGQARSGTVFTLGRDGSGYKLLVDPDPGPDLLYPTALVEGTDGKLYVFVHAGLARYNKDGSGYELVLANSGLGYRWTAMVHGGAVYGIADQGPNRGMIFRYGMGGATGLASAGPAVTVQNLPPVPLDANVELPAASALPTGAGAAAANNTHPQPANPPQNTPSQNPPAHSPPAQPNNRPSPADTAKDKAQKAKEAADKLRGLFGH